MPPPPPVGLPLMPHRVTPNFYALLQVDRTATREQIERAFDSARHTALSDGAGRDLIDLIEQAFRTLSDPAARREHDAAIDGQVTDAPAADAPRSSSSGRLSKPSWGALTRFIRRLRTRPAKHRVSRPTRPPGHLSRDTHHDRPFLDRRHRAALPPSRPSPSASARRAKANRPDALPAPSFDASARLVASRFRSSAS